MDLSKHDRERNRIITDWLLFPSFLCDGCRDEHPFPSDLTIVAETRYADGLRADVGALDMVGRLVGVVEVIDTSRPTPRAFAEQSKLDFAYYRLLNLPHPPRRGGIDYAVTNARFRFPTAKANHPSDGAWLCSEACLKFFEGLRGAERYNEWDAPRCGICNGYLHSNPISRVEFRDWNYDPYTTYCIHCAAHCDASAMQWRTPGDLAGGDPREWTPNLDSGPVELFLAYADAAFWAMVWSERVARLSNPDAYDGGRYKEAEEATTRRLKLVNEAFDAGEWDKGRNLLLPIGAPGWAAYEDEPQRMLAFRADNCRRTAVAWRRLSAHALSVVPNDLKAIINEGKEERERLRSTITPVQDTIETRAESEAERAERWRNASREERIAMLEESRQNPKLLGR